MKFKSLKISNWKQFHAIDIEFHDRLTVLTGSNASGKTTLLNLLGRHFGWDFRELSTPIKELETGKIRFVKPLENLADGTIGEIAYTNHQPLYGRSRRFPDSSPCLYLSQARQ